MRKYIFGPHHSGLSIPDPMQLILAQRFANGRFRPQVVRDGKIIYDPGFKPQVMLNGFFEAYCGGSVSRSALLQYGAVGTGTAEANPTDTTISQVGPRAVAQSVESTATVASNVITQRIQYRWAQGAITVPVTEAALFAASTGGAPMVRSRLKDEFDVSTSIPLTSFDALYLTWEVDSIVNLSDVDSVVDYGGNNYDVKIRPSFWTAAATTDPGSCQNPFAAFSASTSPGANFGFTVGYAGSSQTPEVPTSGPSASAAHSSSSLSSYTANSHQRTISYTWAAGNAPANALSGIGCVSLRNVATGAGYQVFFSKVSDDTKIPKTETNQFRVDLTLAFSI